MSYVYLIPLNNEKFAIVDEEDYKDVSQFKWFAWTPNGKTWYATRGVNTGNGKRTNEYMHIRINKTPKGLETDHINGDGLDNRRCNLRSVTKRQNAQNQHIKRYSLYPGVTWHKNKKRWQAQIRIEGKSVYIGSFKEELKAFEAYCDALKKIGESLV